MQFETEYFQKYGPKCPTKNPDEREWHAAFPSL